MGAAMLRNAITGFTFFEQVCVIMTMSFAKVCVDSLHLHSKCRDIRALLAQYGADGLPNYMQERVCEEWDNENFGTDLILSVACKICVTAVPGWESVLFLSCLQAIDEAVLTKIYMWWTYRDFKRAVKVEKHAAEAILTLKV